MDDISKQTDLNASHDIPWNTCNDMMQYMIDIHAYVCMYYLDNDSALIHN